MKKYNRNIRFKKLIRRKGKKFNFVRVDDLPDTNCGSVYLYCKCSLPLKVIDVSYLQQCINFEVKIGNKACNFNSQNSTWNT